MYSGGRRLVSPTEGVFRVELGGRVSGGHLYTNMKLMELRKNGNVLKNGGVLRYTDKKEIKFSPCIRKFRGNSCKVIYDYRLNICAFLHIMGSPSSYMTLQLIQSEFPYI